MLRLIAVLVGLAACGGAQAGMKGQGTPEAADTGDASKAARSLMQEIYADLRRGDVDGLQSVVAPDVFAQLALSHDEGVAEFLDLSRVKQNTLGNTRMLKQF